MAVLEIEDEEEEELESLTAAEGVDDTIGGSDEQTCVLQARLKRRTAAVLLRRPDDQLLHHHSSSKRRLLSLIMLLLLVMAIAVWRLLVKEEKQEEDMLIPPDETTDRDGEPPPRHNSIRMEGVELYHDDWSDDASIRPIRLSAQTQIERYRNQTGLLVNVHVTHHGGTTFCAAIGHAPMAPKVPDFACNRQRDDPVWEKRKGPWRHDETAERIRSIRSNEGFHMMSWEFRNAPTTVPLMSTDWEHENLLSVYITRDPMTRLLAGDGLVQRLYPGVLSGTAPHEIWEAYAHDDRFTNNFALRVLAGSGCCQGNETSVEYLETAKTLLQRFTVVLDLACLNQGIAALAPLLGIDQPGTLKPPRLHDKSTRDRIGHDDIYDYLLEKNQKDIQLYEWSKSISLVDCSKLE